MNEKLGTYSERRKSSSLDAFSSSRKNQRKANETDPYGRFIPNYDEHDIRTKERISRLYTNLNGYVRSDSSGRNSDTVNQDGLLDPEKILVYINTGGKYNSEIFKRKNEYKNMILDIYNTGGHCLKVMINSFKNMLVNPKVGSVNMTRMDRLVNFLSLVTDLHKNYCDPVVCDMFKVKNTRRNTLLRNSTASKQDFVSEKTKAESTSCSPLSNKNSNNNERRFRSADSNIEYSISSRVLLNIINEKNNNRKKSEIRDIYFQKLKENVNNSRENKDSSYNKRYSSENLNIYRRETKLLEQKEKITSIRDIFESLRESRSVINEKEKSKIGLKTLMNKYPKKDINNSVESDFITNFLNYPQLDQNSISQRIDALQKLLDKLKEIKLGSNYQNFENEEKSFKTNQITVKDSLYSKLNMIPRIVSLSDESYNSKDKNNISNFSSEVAPIDLPSSPNNQSPEISKISNKRWELDTPLVSHRTIDFDEIYNLSTPEVNEKGLLSFNRTRTGILSKTDLPKTKESEKVSLIDSEIHEHENVSESLDESGNKEENKKLSISDLRSENVHFGSIEIDTLFNTIPTDLYTPDERMKVIGVVEDSNGDISDNNGLKGELVIEKKQEMNSKTGFDSENLQYTENLINFRSDLVKDHDLNSTELSEKTQETENRENPDTEIPLNNTETETKYCCVSEDFSKESNICEDSVYKDSNVIVSAQIEMENNTSLINETKNKGNKTIEKVSDKNVEFEVVKSDNQVFEVERLNIEYFTSLNDYDLKRKIDEYNYWYENAVNENYTNLNLDGLSIDEFYYKGLTLIPKCYDGIIDMSSSSVRKMCQIIYEHLQKLSSSEMNNGPNEYIMEKIDSNLSILLREDINEETLLSFIHDNIMKDSRYLEFSSTVRKELSPPDDNYILLIIDLMREILIEWKNENFGVSESQMTIEAITKQVDEILKKSYEPHLSEINSDEWVLKKVFHAPNYPNILESEKELLNIEHLFKYHTCEDLIASDYTNMDRAKWLKTSRYYLPLINNAIEHLVQDLINENIVVIMNFLRPSTIDNK
ncbi:hypothetical protein FG386_001230 [Cryptosporidium ryanae]|uniref:uncharacterized protein n=1 Tax=Cryptosporidium ryanae TaxID=515981 RepID=UPI00351A86BF|nr:hypothetical protein FG386_001230 [Cryptosporidium ryanae]